MNITVYNTAFCWIYFLNVKLCQLNVLSTKTVFKTFEKNKSRSIEKMRIKDVLVFGSR